MSSRNNFSQLAAICFAKGTSSTAFAVFFSGLSLYLTQAKSYNKESSAIITGLFLSLNYLLPMIGGLIANRIISYKKFYCLGSLASVIGCLMLGFNFNLKLGLSLFLMSSLVTNVCLNMFITTLFKDDQISERRIAFIWNYIGMNAGFLAGYLLTGYYNILNNYSHLFIIMSVLIISSLGFTLFFIKNNEENLVIKKSYFTQITLTTIIISALVLIINLLFSYATIAEKYMMIFSIIVLIGLMYFSYTNSALNDRKKIFQFSFYSFLAITFWTVYMLTPTAVMQIIQNDVQRTIFGFKLAPQWFVNIDSIVILLIAPQFAFLLKRQKNIHGQYDNPLRFFSYAFLFAALAFFILFLGLHDLINETKLPIWGMLGYLIFLTLAEIFISPIGNALVGELIPSAQRGLMMGVVSINIGIGGLLASQLAKHYILPFVDKNGLTGTNLIQFQSLISIIGFILITLTLFLFIYTKSLKTSQLSLIHSK